MLCRTCQYDLDGLAPNWHELVICPECGLAQSPIPDDLPALPNALRSWLQMAAPPAILLVFALFISAAGVTSIAITSAILSLLAGFVGPIAVAISTERQIGPRPRGRGARVTLILTVGWTANLIILPTIHVVGRSFFHAL